LALGLVLFAALLHGVGLGVVAQASWQLGWLIPLIVIPYFCAYILDSVRWWWVLSREFARGVEWPAVSLSRLFAIRAAGEVANAMTPTAYLGGKPARAWIGFG
jgi:hypothetical protein